MGVSSPVSPKQRLGTASPQTESPKCTELGGPVGLGPEARQVLSRATGNRTDLDADLSYRVYYVQRGQGALELAREL